MFIIFYKGELRMKKKLTAAAILLIALCLCVVKPVAINESDKPSKDVHSSQESSGSDNGGEEGEPSKDDKIQEIIGGGNRTDSGAE